MKRFSRSFLLWLVACACVFLVAGTASRAATAPFPREKGAFYLEDFVRQPYRLAVLTDAPIYYNADAARFLGTLRRGQAVELLAVRTRGGVVRVRGQAQQGQVVGWVPERYLTALDPSFVEGLQRASDRREQVRALAANNEVALNMTAEEINATLGQPAKKSTHTDLQGASETWEYVRYENIPRQVVGTDQFGRLFTTIVYDRVAVGSYAVTFVGGLARSIDQADKTGATVANPVPVRTVPPPVVFHF